MQQHRRGDEHVLIVPGARNERIANERSRIYSIRSPMVSSSTQYRALLDLRAIGEVIEHERPDLIESSDPYQVGWGALRSARLLRVPVVAFYHSHFPEAYFRAPAERLGRRPANWIMQMTQSYIQNFYNRFAATLVPSAGLSTVLESWGVRNTRQIALGVNTDVFSPCDGLLAVRNSLGIRSGDSLLLYVGRLAAEKNTQRLFEAFAELAKRVRAVHLLVIGDGQQRETLEDLKQRTGRVTWIPYLADQAKLAEYYRAADLFVHPGVEETFGLAALESQACGTPVVGFRGSFMDEVILHEQTDWADENTSGNLACAIERMLARPDLRALGATAAKSVAQRFAWTAVFERLFSFYDSLVRQ